MCIYTARVACCHSVLGGANEFCTFHTGHTCLDIFRWFADLAPLPLPFSHSIDLERIGQRLLCLFADPKTHTTCSHTGTHTDTHTHEQHAGTTESKRERERVRKRELGQGARVAM